MAHGTKKGRTLELEQIKAALRGRTITDIRVERFRDGRGGWAESPILLLDTGARIYFSVQETETPEYGIKIGITQELPPNPPT